MWPRCAIFGDASSRMSKLRDWHLASMRRCRIKSNWSCARLASMTTLHYELVVRSQSGAEELVRELGAFAEIERAVLDHCNAGHPEPRYKPQEYKKRLAAFGWIPEVRVPPYS